VTQKIFHLSVMKKARAPFVVKLAYGLMLNHSTEDRIWILFVMLVSKAAS
jgi:hypothetical protein